MKKLLLLFIPLVSFGQYFSNGKPLKEVDAEYITVRYKSKSFKLTSVSITVEDGTAVTDKEYTNYYIVDAVGSKKPFYFNGLSAVLNYFDKIDYEYIETLQYEFPQNGYFILRKKSNKVNIKNIPTDNLIESVKGLLK
jgi:hypothetical protein